MFEPVFKSIDDVLREEAVPHLTCGAVRELQLPLPDLATRSRVVSQSGVLQTVTDRLRSIDTRKLAALDELKQALRHQAFSGAL